ncbi:MFS transporter [Streptomyces katsurahamanus]|uniref:MFS transporter n=1 Tax=Streptomyces katsurahamanus TaxID=2577098 RepID=A0ABW9NPS9_9ACTN|nr:MFS transporter [Streptomyces katsurahamanus]MQS35302.1 MFS transporter [Streptomyces katsurahamanus]
MTQKSPWRLPDFRTLFSAVVLTNLAVNIGYLAFPLIAVTALDARPAELGILVTLMTAAFLLIGLPAGAWVDRMRHRRVMITAELARAALLASIPLAWWLDALTLWQLYAVVLLNGCATVFFDVAHQSILPPMVGREALIPANAALVGLQAVGQMAGRGAGGGIVQLLTAPVATIAMVLLHLASALRLTAIRPVPLPEPTARPPRLTTQIAEGLRHVLGHRELRALAVAGSLLNLGVQLINTVLPVVFTRELGLSAGVLGLYWAAGGAGALLGSRCARPLARRMGGDYTRTLAVVGLCLVPAPFAIPLIDRGGWLWLSACGWALLTFKFGIDNVLAVTVRQRLTPDALLGRTSATFRFMLFGALALGSALAGLIGELAGVRAAMWVGVGFIVLAVVPLLPSLRRCRPAPSEEDGGTARTRSTNQRVDVPGQ